LQKRVQYCFCLLLICLCFTACDIQSDFKNKGTRPSLSAEKMIDILADIHIAETVVKDNILKRDSFRFETIDNYYASIFTIHEVTEKEFKTSLKHYMANPQELEDIYVEVEKKLAGYAKKKPKVKK